MAYSLDARTGLPMVGGIPLPLTPEQMAAAGIDPMQAPGGIPLPQGGNPYGGLPANAVAGPGGGAPTDMGTADQSVMLAAQPQAQQLSPAAFRAAVGAPPAPVEHEAPLSRSDALLSAGGGDAAAQPPRLLPTTVAEAQQGAASDASVADRAQQQRIFDASLRGSGGGGKAPELGVTSETVKSKEYGTIPQALASDIDARQQAVDKADAAQMGAVAQSNAADLGRQQQVIEQQMRDAAVAQQRQALVQQRVSQLEAKSDADEAALTKAKPKEVSAFWGGSAAAQILSAISVALGAGVQTRTGHNPAQEILDKALDRWQNDQIQQYNAAKDKATLSNNKYKDLLAVYGTPEAAQAQLSLQALAAKNAMAQNMAEQSKNQLWLANAQNMQQKDQLERQKARAVSLQTAGMKEVEQKMALRGGTGSAADRELAALKKQAEAKKYQDEIHGQTNEDKRTEIEANKAQATGASGAAVSRDAADAIDRLAQKASSFGDRASPAQRGEIADAHEDAVNKYAAMLVATKGASARGAREAAEQYIGSRDSLLRSPTADTALRARAKTLRGNAVRGAAAHAAGIQVTDSSEEGSPE